MVLIPCSQMQAEKMIASLGILNYILSLLNNAVITAGKEAGEQAVKEVWTEMVEVVNEQLVQNSLQIQEQVESTSTRACSTSIYIIDIIGTADSREQGESNGMDAYIYINYG